MANSDGTVVLTVEIDTNSVNSELNRLKSTLETSSGKFGSVTSSAKETQNAFQSLSNFIKIQEERLTALKEQYSSYVLQGKESSAEAKQLKTDIKNLSTSLAENREKLSEASNSADKFDKSLSVIKTSANSTITTLKKVASSLGIYFSLREIVRFSNEASKLASETEANLKRMSMLYGEAAQEVYDFANKNAFAFGMAKSEAYDAAADYGNIFRTFANGADSAKLTNQMLQQTAVIASQTGRTYEDVFEKIRSGLYGNTRAIDDLGLSVRQASIEESEAFRIVSGGTKAWNDMTDAELQQVRALEIVNQSYIKYGNTVLQSTALTRSQFNAAWTDFKQTWGQVVNIVLMPILKVATKVLNTISAALAKIFKLTGKEFSTTSSTVTSVDDTLSSVVDNQDALTDSVKATNKELKKELASFDEIEILSRDAADNSSGGSSGSGISGVSGGIGNSGEIISDQEIEAGLSAIVGVVIGAVAVGLGLILMFSGHFLLGLGLVIAGGIIIWEEAEELSKTLDVDVKSRLEKLAKFVGKAAVGLGVILLFVPSCFMYGLGLIAAGAAALGFSEKLTNPDTEFSDLMDKIINIVQIGGLIAFYLGVVLVFVPGQFLTGLGLMAKGAGALFITSKLDGDEPKTELEKFCTKHWAAIAVIGIIMVCVGVIVLFTGHWKIGLAMLFIGISALVIGNELSGGKLKQGLETFCAKHWMILYAIGIIMVCVGIAVLFSGLWQVGLTLIILGIADLVGTTMLGGDSLKSAIADFCSKYWLELQKLGLLMFILGAILMFTGLWPTAIGLMYLGVKAVNISEKFSPEGVEAAYPKPIQELKDWMLNTDSVMFVLGLILLFVPGAMGVGVDLLKRSSSSVGKSASLNSNDVKASVQKNLDDVKSTVARGVSDINSEYAKIGQVSTSNVKVGTTTTVASGSKNVSTTSYSTAASAVSYEVPALAKGTVLPGGMPYLAVVNDNPRGQPNIEAPAELIKQMAKEAYEEMGLANNQQQQIIKEEHYNLNQTELMTIMYKLVKGGERLNGTSLVKQGGI